METSNGDVNSVLLIDPSELDDVRANVLKCQIATYRLLARNLPVSDQLIASCSYKVQLTRLLKEHLERTQAHPTSIVLGQTLKDDSSITFSSPSEMYRWLVGSNEENSTFTRIRQHGIHTNPIYIQQERDKRYE